VLAASIPTATGIVRTTYARHISSTFLADRIDLRLDDGTVTAELDSPPMDATCAVIWRWVRAITQHILTVAYTITVIGTTRPIIKPQKMLTAVNGADLSPSKLYIHVAMFHETGPCRNDAASSKPLHQVQQMTA